MKKLKLIIASFLLLVFHSIGYSQTYAKQNLSRQDSAQVKVYTENYEMYLGKADLRNASDFLNQIATIYWNRNHFRKSTEYYHKSLELNQKLGNKNGIAGINSNLGMIYSDLGEYQKSVDHLSKAVAARRSEKKTYTERENLFNALLNLSSSLKQLKKYKDAISYLEEALSYARELNNLEKIAVFYLQLAEVHESAGNIEESRRYTEKYMTFYKQMKEEQVTKSRIAMENAKLKSVRISLEKRLKELELIEKTEELEKKDLEVKEYVSKSDSLANTLSKSQLATQILEEQAELERVEKQRNRIIFISIISIVAIIALLFFYAFRQKKKANTILSKKNYEILSQQEEIIAQKEVLMSINKELDKKNNQIMESINYAKLIQTAMLQRETALETYVPESFILFKPRDVVSGDFYWYTNKGDKLIVAAIDCTGHGVPGAFMSMIGSNILNQLILNENITQPNIILEELHKGVNTALNQKHTGNDDGMDASIFIIDKKKKTICFAGARNSIFIIRNDVMEELEGDEISVGGLDRRQDDKFTKKEIKIDGDVYLYSFSDGYQDQFGGEKNKKFMASRLKDMFYDIHKEEMDEQKMILDTTIEKWKFESNAKQTDDILIIGMHLEL